jgi:hypothetical protein
MPGVLKSLKMWALANFRKTFGLEDRIKAKF